MKVELSTLLAIRVCVFVKKQPPQSAYRVKDFSVCKVINSIYPDLYKLNVWVNLI